MYDALAIAVFALVLVVGYLGWQVSRLVKAVEDESDTYWDAKGGETDGDADEDGREREPGERGLGGR